MRVMCGLLAVAVFMLGVGVGVTTAVPYFVDDGFGLTVSRR
jgi:hypothetical protein